ncbi:DUF4835 family protein [Balneolaceae bacterium ANBcel3]|nr:DUF4835 family protein [Balneolaceae bacterium ANBcel3]
MLKPYTRITKGRKTMRFTVAILALLLISMFGRPVAVQANQVFDVNVSINTSQISTTDYDYLDDLEPLIKEYLETNSWTEDRFGERERITVNIQVIINDVSDRNFQSTLIISTERPIYGTLQITPLFLHSDNNWSFEYSRGQSLLFDTYQYHDMASVLDFYAHVILGFDYDSFSEFGGEDFYREALRIADMGLSSGSGWGGSGVRRSRHDLVSQLLNPDYEDFRRAVYMYHRLGLDTFTTEPQASRTRVLEAFHMIHEAQRRTSSRFLFDLLFSAKNREFRAFFMDAPTETRLDAYNILITIDESRVSEYGRLQR